MKKSVELNQNFMYYEIKGGDEVAKQVNFIAYEQKDYATRNG